MLRSLRLRQVQLSFALVVFPCLAGCAVRRDGKLVYFGELGGGRPRTPPPPVAGSSPEGEYQAALQEYNQALKDLQTARFADNLNALSRGSLLGEGLNLLTKASISDAVRAVELARQRLEAAEAQRTAEAGRTQVNVYTDGQGSPGGQRTGTRTNDTFYDGPTSDGGHYVGECMSGKQHGLGTYTWANGR